MSPRELKELITILAPIATDAFVGEQTVSYRAQLDVRAKVDNFKQIKVVEFKQAQLKATIAVTIPYLDWLTESHRLCWNGNNYSIESLTNVDNKSRWLYITAYFIGSSL